jgi:hypothetical protein
VDCFRRVRRARSRWNWSAGSTQLSTPLRRAFIVLGLTLANWTVGRYVRDFQRVLPRQVGPGLLNTPVIKVPQAEGGQPDSALPLPFHRLELIFDEHESSSVDLGMAKNNSRAEVLRRPSCARSNSTCTCPARGMRAAASKVLARIAPHAIHRMPNTSSSCTLGESCLMRVACS